MLTFTEATSTKSVNDSINFDISMLDANGVSCSVCTYAVTTSPLEVVTYNPKRLGITSPAVLQLPNQDIILSYIQLPTPTVTSLKEKLVYWLVALIPKRRYII